MRAARLHGTGDVRVHEEPEPPARPGWERVRVTAVGICGSDLHWFTEAGIGDAALSRPLVLGHEIGGVIEGGARDGVRVAVDPAIPCETCEACRTGWRNLCPAVAFAGHGTNDGGLREVLVWPSALLHPVPDDLDDAEVALLEPLGVALHALDLAHVRLGGTVAVVGCGPIGLGAVAAARLAGASRVVAVEVLEHRRRAALDLGADQATEPDDAALADLGADAVIEMAGNDAAVEASLHAVRPGGRVVLGGIPDADTTTFRASLARRKGVTLALLRRMNEAYPRAISLAASGRLPLRPLATDVLPMTQAQDAFRRAAAREGLKVVIDPRR